MKRVTVQLNQIIGAVLLTVSFWACNDFLDEQPSKSTRLPITHTEQLDALLANYTDFAKNPTGRLSVVTTIGNSRSSCIRDNRCSSPDRMLSCKPTLETMKIWLRKTTLSGVVTATNRVNTVRYFVPMWYCNPWII